MLTDARGLYRPRHGYRKPRGIPQVIRQFAPRGLQLCAPLNDPGFRLATINGGPFQLTPPTLSSSPKLVGTPYGQGFNLVGGSECVSYQLVGAQPATNFSMEMLLFNANPVFDGTFCGWNAAADGSSDTADRMFFSGPAGAGLLKFYTFDGAIKETAVAIASYPLGLSHFVGTADGTTMRVYRQGAQVTTLLAGAAFTGYTNPFFCIGKASASAADAGHPGAVAYNNGVVLLVNFANVTWTPAEVQERYLNPFGFLQWPEDRVSFVPSPISTMAPRGWFDAELVGSKAWFG